MKLLEILTAAAGGVLLGFAIGVISAMAVRFVNLSHKVKSKGFTPFQKIRMDARNEKIINDAQRKEHSASSFGM